MAVLTQIIITISHMLGMAQLDSKQKIKKYQQEKIIALRRLKIKVAAILSKVSAQKKQLVSQQNQSKSLNLKNTKNQTRKQKHKKVNNLFHYQFETLSFKEIQQIKDNQEYFLNESKHIAAFRSYLIHKGLQQHCPLAIKYPQVNFISPDEPNYISLWGLIRRKKYSKKQMYSQKPKFQQKITSEEIKRQRLQYIKLRNTFLNSFKQKSSAIHDYQQMMKKDLRVNYQRKIEKAKNRRQHQMAQKEKAWRQKQQKYKEKILKAKDTERLRNESSSVELAEQLRNRLIKRKSRSMGFIFVNDRE